METHKTVAQSVREEIAQHRRRLLKLEESAVRIANTHNCPNHSLIRLALLRQSMASGTVVKL
ncbi:hypothetical protein [Pelagibacterium halotolerans]|uniref:Uncharacterized protein n=1 Tax=Pelagibacterium halotolerans (strain DSM 22347 / JCM 15775 / CGMCC 1.7692 / B2) TaxID=1082931 RepID=G4RCU5_PELHB|nr:hypothetical protein [Pelagibacterium halotolerans]AEQ51750.1 hypothetical protein KKY_1735 [Pelagibacterium halotolerans B2]QJR18434.1 hypothetical protein HKM20_08320 [Pelagibacterium halotolerans]SEA22236.1 hypothetical protein SAMN05428936_102370 [Pelagibacterium halotolerans]